MLTATASEERGQLMSEKLQFSLEDLGRLTRYIEDRECGKRGQAFEILIEWLSIYSATEPEARSASEAAALGYNDEYC